MKSELKNLPKSKVEIKIGIPNEEFKKFIEKATEELGKDLEVKGFRKGQAPKNVVRENIGVDKILSQAAEEAVRDKYFQLIKEKDLEPITQPKVEVLKLAEGNDFEFKITTTVLPEIELPDYKKLASGIEKKEVSLSDQEIEDALKWLQKSRAKFTPLDRPAKKGDFVEIEYESPQINKSKKTKDGFEVGKGHFIPGFEEKMEGMKKEEEKEFSLTFPKDYKRENLAGKRADFKVKLLEVKKMEVPEINDKFASDLGQFESLEALKKNIKEGLEQEKQISEKQRRRNQILENIAEKTKVEIPEELIETEKNKLFEDFKENISQKTKMPFEDYLNSVKKDEEELKKSFASQAEKKIEFFLILKEVGKKESIKVEEKEVEEGVNENLKQYTPEQKEKVDLNSLKGYTREVIYNEKVFQKLENFVN